MAKQRITVYPAPRTLAILGDGSPGLNLALDAYARMIGLATVDNEDEFSRGEWCALADVSNGTIYSPDVSPALQLVAQIEDADVLEGLGTKWEIDAQALAEKLRKISDVRAWAIVFAVRRYWDRHQEIDLQRDEWWRLR